MSSSPPAPRATASSRHCSPQADITAPNVPPLPEHFAHYRRDLGALVYGAMGVGRNDPEARRLAVLRNWEFFRAPLAGIVCMHRDLDYVDAIAVGMFLQTFVLALTARGLGSCVQVSVAGYPEILREQLHIGDEYRILCGVSIGYPDPDIPCELAERSARPSGSELHLRRRLKDIEQPGDHVAAPE